MGSEMCIRDRFGLALTRTLCVRRGGSVSVRNDDGAVFSAHLPLPAAVR